MVEPLHLISPVNYDFRDGDEVVYTSSTPISGLVSGASYLSQW